MHHALKNVHQRQTEGKWKVNFDQLKIDPKIQLIKVDSFDRVRYGPDFMQHHIVVNFSFFSLTFFFFLF